MAQCDLLGCPARCACLLVAVVIPGAEVAARSAGRARRRRLGPRGTHARRLPGSGGAACRARLRPSSARGAFRSGTSTWGLARTIPRQQPTREARAKLRPCKPSETGSRTTAGHRRHATGRRPRSTGKPRNGASRTRTGDLLGAIQALSQLSYSPNGDPGTRPGCAPEFRGSWGSDEGSMVWGPHGTA